MSCLDYTTLGEFGWGVGHHKEYCNNPGLIAVGQLPPLGPKRREMWMAKTWKARII